MNPGYDNSVPFYPTIPNQNTFFPNQMQHNGQYSRDTYAHMHYQNASYSAPAPLNVPYTPSYGYNSNRSVFFPPPSQRATYPNLGINANVATVNPNNHHNPGYYPNASTGLPCTCANPVNSNHVPPYHRLVHVGDLVYPPSSDPNNSTRFNSHNAHWPRNQNNTYYPPANPVAGNSTNWHYDPSYTQPAQNLRYPSSHNYHTATGNSSWMRYSSQNTFRPIPDIDSLSDFSFDTLSSPSELHLLGSTPDLPAWDHNFTLPISPAPNVAPSLSVNTSQSSLEGCENHRDINQNSASVINSQDNQATDATVVSLDQAIVQEEPISIDVVEDLMNCDTQAANSDQVKSNSTTTAGHSSNNITSTPVSTVNTTTAKNGTESVLESKDTGLNHVINPSALSSDIQNIKDSGQDQTLDDSIAQAEKISENVENVIEPKSTAESALETTGASANLEVETSTTSATSVNPPSPRSSNSKQTTANLTVVNTEECQPLNNNTDNPNNNSQPKLEQQSSGTAKSNYETLSPKYTCREVNLPAQISTNFRRLLIKYLNRLDNVKITTDPHSSFVNIDDDIINCFVASLNSENRRLLQQNPINIGTENLPNVSDNVLNENQQNGSNIEMKEMYQNVDTEPEPEHSEANFSNIEMKEENQNTDSESEAKQDQENDSNIEMKEENQNTDSESEAKQDQENVSNREVKEENQNVDTEPELEQCNVLLESCADQEETPISEQDSTESQQHLSEYQAADDVDIINTNLDTIEVTVGDVCNNSIDEDFLEDVPLDLAKEKPVPEPEEPIKSRYFEVSQFLPKSNMYWQYFDSPLLDDNTYDSYANDSRTHSVDVLVELPLNLTCKNRSTTTVESQREDSASNYPELSLLLTPEPILNGGAKGTKGNATKKKGCSFMETVLNANILSQHSPDSSEPPMKKVRIYPGDPRLLQKNDKSKI